VKTVVLEVSSPATAAADFLRTWETRKGHKEAHIGFATPELLWKVLTAKRWEILKALCGAGPVSIREAARRVGRDVKAVHADITALLNAGVLDKTEKGSVEFPYQTIRIEFQLQAA
jgi:predicted transcriptional regulator